MDGSAPLYIKLEQNEYDVSTCENLTQELLPAYTHRNVIVDMSGVRYMDSTGLGRLVRMRNERVGRGLPVARLVITSDRIRHLFEIVQFDVIWPIYDSLEAALNAYMGAEEVGIKTLNPRQSVDSLFPYLTKPGNKVWVERE